VKLTGEFSFRAVLPDGEVREWTATNTPTHEGMLEMLNFLMLQGPARTWDIGFVDIAGFTTGYAQTDTEASHPGWVATGHSGQVWDSTVATVAGDNLSASMVMTHTFEVPFGPNDSRGVYVFDTFGVDVLFATADYNQGPQLIPAGTEMTTIYTVTFT